MSEKPLQSDTINFSAIARSHLTQFALAAAKNYKPAAQSQPIDGTSTSTSTNSTTGNNSTTTNSNPGATASNTYVAPVASNADVSKSAASNSTSNSTTQSPATTNSNAEAQNSASSASKTSGLSLQKKHQAKSHEKSPYGKFGNSTEFQPPVPREFNSSELQSCKFVLLDPYVLEVTQDYEDVTGTFLWEVCESQVDRCLEFIKTESAKKRIFLVCSGGLGAQIAPKINDLPNLYGIYVYCGNVHYHMEWATKYSKVRIICDQDKDFLIPQLAVDVAQTNLEWSVDLLKKNGDKAKAKKKLEQALKNVEKYAKENPQPALLEEIRRRLKECN